MNAIPAVDRRPAGAGRAVPFVAFAALACAVPCRAGVVDKACPPGAIPIAVGTSVQQVVERAGEGAAFCLKSGTHRIQAIRPLARQSFHGEAGTVLNGSRIVSHFERQGGHWVAGGQSQRGQKHGECGPASPACALPEAVFVDDKPLRRVLSLDDLGPGGFFLDYARQTIALADDPRGHKVEATVAAFAFESLAPSVAIRNLTIEKYATVAQKGAIQAQGAERWIVEHCDIRLNSAGGIAVGNGAVVRENDIHDNGQIGITGVGNAILIENNRIWSNNTRGFSTAWEAGGIKLALARNVVIRGNTASRNNGPGIWCDIDCRGVLYERNLVEANATGGIAHEISFDAVIRDNVLRDNGAGSTGWYFGADILVAASQNVEVTGNRLSVRSGGCGVVLIDQSRDRPAGAGKYKTRNNRVHDNQMTFADNGCSGGASDVPAGDENYSVITEGNNRFDRNVYRLSKSSARMRFAWGHGELDWQQMNALGIERNGRLDVP